MATELIEINPQKNHIKHIDFLSLATVCDLTLTQHNVMYQTDLWDTNSFYMISTKRQGHHK